MVKVGVVLGVGWLARQGLLALLRAVRPTFLSLNQMFVFLEAATAAAVACVCVCVCYLCRVSRTIKSVHTRKTCLVAGRPKESGGRKGDDIYRPALARTSAGLCMSPSLPPPLTHPWSASTQSVATRLSFFSPSLPSLPLNMPLLQLHPTPAPRA